MKKIKKCPTHLIPFIQLFDGQVDKNGEWTKGFFCPAEIDICRTPEGDFAGHKFTTDFIDGGFFGTSHMLTKCKRNCNFSRRTERRLGQGDY